MKTCELPSILLTGMTEQISYGDRTAQRSLISGITSRPVEIIAPVSFSDNLTDLLVCQQKTLLSFCPAENSYGQSNGKWDEDTRYLTSKVCLLLVVNREGHAIESLGRNLNRNGAKVRSGCFLGIIDPADASHNLFRALCKCLEFSMPPPQPADFSENLLSKFLFFCRLGGFIILSQRLQCMQTLD